MTTSVTMCDGDGDGSSWSRSRLIYLGVRSTGGGDARHDVVEKEPAHQNVPTVAEHALGLEVVGVHELAAKIRHTHRRWVQRVPSPSGVSQIQLVELLRLR